MTTQEQQKQEVVNQLKTLLLLREQIQKTNILAPHFSLENCPLNFNGNHYANSEIIFGQGCWQWECKFCGEVDSE